MAKALLAGNGFNRLDQSDKSWANVLDALASEIGQPQVAEGLPDKPFTLVYEEIVLRSLRRNGKERDIKGVVADNLHDRTILERAQCDA